LEEKNFIFYFLEFFGKYFKFFSTFENTFEKKKKEGWKNQTILKRSLDMQNKSHLLGVAVLFWTKKD
jgi:hypothetical protein